MAEYIEIIECRDCESKNCDGCNVFVLSQMLNDGKLDSLMDEHHSIIPAADVAPVVHGRWKGEGMGDYSCSLCTEVVSGNEYNYCPNCGARMDGE